MILGVIPARYGASRLPGKPLAMIGDRPMVQWVYESAIGSSALDRLVVATDSEEVHTCVRGFGGEAVMTSSRHTSGTDRCAEVAAEVPEAEVIANIQGDQPFVTAEMVDQLLDPYVEGSRPDMSTVACPLEPTIADDPNVVKVICRRDGHALYFSRAPIPFRRTRGPAPVFHHLGLYAFSRQFLLEYAQLEPTPLEEREQLEQLRALEHGHSIVVSLIDHPVLEVNTADDLARARASIAQGEA